MSCTGLCVIKLYLLIFDCVFILTGLAVAAVGAVTTVSVADLHGAYEDISFFYLPYVLIAIGVLCVILGIIGFIAAYKEIPTLLLVFFASLIIIFGVEVILGVLGLIYSSQLENEVTTELKESLKSYKEEPIMDTWDRLQTNRECCGVDSYQDWSNITNSDFPKGQAPDSCCIYFTSGCGMAPNAEFHKQGCKDNIVDVLEDNIFILGAVVVACGIFQLFGILASLLLYCSLQRKGEYV